MADEGHETQARDLLVEHARRALIHELGTARVEAWLGKDGLHRHDVAELASIVVDSCGRCAAIVTSSTGSSPGTTPATSPRRSSWTRTTGRGIGPHAGARYGGRRE